MDVGSSGVTIEPGRKEQAMALTRKDWVATGLVAAVLVIYVAYLAFDGIPLVRDVTGMAAVGLILGFASRRIGGRAGFRHERLAFAGGLGSIALGIVTLITGSEAVLAVFVASIVGLWAAAMYVRTHSIGAEHVPLAHS
jgi:hypothetical protein